MKRKERFFGVLLSLMLMLGLMAGMSLSAHAETTYNVWVGGTRVTSGNMDDVLGDGKVSFTPADGGTPAILTLNGAAITGGYTFNYNAAAIYARGDLTIDVTADSTVTGPDSDSGHSYCVYSGGSLTVTGTGELTAAGGDAYGNSYGVYANSGAVAVNGELTAEGGTSTNGYSYGVFVNDGAITVNGELTAEGGTSTIRSSYGVWAYRDVTVAEGGTLTGTGGAATNLNSYGVYANSGAVTVAEGGTLTAAGGTSTNGNSYGVYAYTAVTFAEGARLTAEGGTQAVKGSVANAIAGTGWTNADGTGSMAGIVANDQGQSLDSYKKIHFPAVVAYDVWVGGTWVTELNAADVLGDGKVSFTPADGGTPATLTLDGAAITGYTFEYNAAAIYAEGDLTIDVMANSTVTGPDNGSGYSYGVYCGGSLTVTGPGELTAAGGDAYGVSCGVYAQEAITVAERGTLTAEGGTSTNDRSCGVYANSIAVTVNGMLTGTGGTSTNDISCGVRALYGAITVAESGTLTGEGGTAGGGSYGVYAYDGAITVAEGGTLTGEGGTSGSSSYGFYAWYGAVTVNGTLTAEGGTAGVSSYGVYAGGDKAITVNGTLTGEGGTATYGNSYGVYANSGAVTVTAGGTLEATGDTAGSSSFGFFANGAVTVAEGATLTAESNTRAIYGSVTNAVAGIGWTDAAGTGDAVEIAVSTEGQTLEYKKVHFPMPLYDVWVGGTQVTGANMNDVLGDGKVSYTPAAADDPATTDADETAPATLTLDGAAITGGYTFNDNAAAIYAEGDLTIDVTADSTVTGPDNGSGNSYGVYSGGSLTFTGAGMLTAAGGDAYRYSYGVYAYKGAVTVNGTLTAAGSKATGTDGESYGVWADGAVTAGGTLDATGDEASAFSYGVYTLNGAVTVAEGGTLTGTGGTSTDEYGSSCGVWATGDVTVEANGTLTGRGGTSTNYFNYGVWADGAVTVAGTLTGTGGTSTNGNSCGVYAETGDVTVNAAATLTAAGNKRAIDGSVTNAVAGTGWTDATGTAGMAHIAVNTTGQTLEYKKLQFPVPPFGTPDFTLPGSIRTVEANAFEGGAMTVVSVPDGCEVIGAGAFKDCGSLTQIRVPAGCAIGDGAFSGCGTVFVYAPAGSPAESFCAAPANANCVFCETAD